MKKPKKLPKLTRLDAVTQLRQAAAQIDDVCSLLLEESSDPIEAVAQGYLESAFFAVSQAKVLLG